MPRISGDDGEWRFPFRRDAPYYSELPVLAGSIAKPTAFPFAAAPTPVSYTHLEDYAVTGQTAERMGLAGMTPEAIRNLVSA